MLTGPIFSFKQYWTCNIFKALVQKFVVVPGTALVFSVRASQPSISVVKTWARHSPNKIDGLCLEDIPVLIHPLLSVYSHNSVNYVLLNMHPRSTNDLLAVGSVFNRRLTWCLEVEWKSFKTRVFSFFFFQPITHGVVSLKSRAWSSFTPLYTRNITFSIDRQSSVSQLDS